MRAKAALQLITDVAARASAVVVDQERMGVVLEVLAEAGLQRPCFWLLDTPTQEVVLVLPADAPRRQPVGEGTAGRAVASGEVVVEPGFVCAPIRDNGEVIGALSAGRAGAIELSAEAAVLLAVASMVRGTARRLRATAPDVNARSAPGNLVGRSKGMQAVYDQIAQVATSDTTVLLRGESGVGKELVAEAIHAASRRRDRPFVRVNCAALPQSVIESELFGHERGAFTGAVARRAGRFELAHGGTLFLDEIGDLPPATQVALLRVLQSRSFERVGGTETVQVDVRVITATNRDLEAMLANDRFRSDLYYRLNVFPLFIPALRERRADVLLLADHFVARYGANASPPVRRISTPAIDALLAYHWPGNVRELENCIERAVLVAEGEVIRAMDLPVTLQLPEASAPREATLQLALDRLEREMLVDALKVARGNKAKAARALGLSERVIGLRVAKHQLKPRSFKTKGNFEAEPTNR